MTIQTDVVRLNLIMTRQKSYQIILYPKQYTYIENQIL